MSVISIQVALKPKYNSCYSLLCTVFINAFNDLLKNLERFWKLYDLLFLKHFLAFKNIVD